MNDIFTQVVELARSLGLGKLGHVAIDSTRIAANAATNATETPGKAARGTRQDPQEHSAVAATVRERRSE